MARPKSFEQWFNFEARREMICGFRSLGFRVSRRKRIGRGHEILTFKNSNHQLAFVLHEDLARKAPFWLETNSPLLQLSESEKAEVETIFNLVTSQPPEEAGWGADEHQELE